MNEFSCTVTYSGVTTPEAVRTATSVLEEVLGLYEMLEDAVYKHFTT
ncbi:MAG: hypothetical protein QXP80_03000 [Zestosphaera sp.]